VETCSFVPLGRVDPCRLNLQLSRATLFKV
jgi:hypothetical protein